MKIDHIDVELQLHLPDAVRTVLALWALDLDLAAPARQPGDAAAMGELLRAVAARGQPARVSCAELAALHDYATRAACATVKAASHPAPAADVGAEADRILRWLAQC